MVALDRSAIDELAEPVLASGMAPAVALAVTDRERLRFDTPVDGRAQRAVLSGTPYYGAFTGLAPVSGLVRAGSG